MKAITLWQPWASLWLTTAKVHETRHWQTHHRGYLLVHAAKRPLDRELPHELWHLCRSTLGEEYQFPLGAIIGRVELIDCLSTNDFSPVDHQDRICGNFGANRYMWKRGRFHVFDKPIPYKGRQNMFDIPQDFFFGLLYQTDSK